MTRDRRGKRKLLAVLVPALCASVTLAADWPSWRGPSHNGVSTEQNLPERVDPATDVRWSVDMPGTSSATPVVSGNRVFVISNDETDRKLFALCIDTDSGKVLWNKLLAEIEGEFSSRNTIASCSPVTDGELVYFTSGTGAVFAFDFEGRERWRASLTERYGQIGQQFGYSSTPLLHTGNLYFPILRGQWERGRDWDTFTQKDSRIVCLDGKSGEERWNTHRASDARAESFDAYTSPIPYEFEGGDAVVVQGGDYVTAHDVRTGEELWRHGYNPTRGEFWRLIPSPVAAGRVIAGQIPRGRGAFGVIPGQSARTAYDDSLWIYDERTSDVTTPCYYDGKLFLVIGTRRILVVLDPHSGNVLGEADLDADSRIWSSPVIGDEKMYCLDEDGQLSITSIGGAIKPLSKADFGGRESKSSVAISDGSLYIRTSEKLYKVGG